MIRWLLILTLFLLACNITSVISGLPTPTPYALTSTPSPTITPTTEFLIVKNETVYLREYATKNSRALDVLKGGQVVKWAGECSGNWVKVEYQSETGWMSADWLTGKVCR